MKVRRSHREEGAALVLVLALISMLSMIVILAVDATAMGVRRTQNLESMSQARWHLLGAEAFARARIADIQRGSAEGALDQSDWQAKPFAFPLDHGVMGVTLYDGSNCFNLNSLVTVDDGGAQGANLTAQVQFARLIAITGMRADNPMVLAAAAIDWIDGDQVISPGGAEDETYVNAGYRAANSLLGDVRELGKVRGFTPELVAALGAHICVRPTTMPNAINPNTLRADQARFLSAMVGQSLPLAAAETLIRNRPRGGWATLDAFFAEPALAQIGLSEAMRAGFTRDTRYFVVASAVQWKDARETAHVLIDTNQDARVVRRVLGVLKKEPAL
jgi:general secretion pathway protein K